MKKFFAIKTHTADMDIILLLLRLVFGYAFILHGWGKIQMPMGWMPPGSPVPGFLQALAAIAEFGGGIAIILGFLTRLSGLGLAVTMLVAVYFHAVILGHPFVNTSPAGNGSFELALVYLILSVLIIITGPGRFSMDGKIFGKV